MNVSMVCRAFGVLAIPALFVSNALAYDELDDGDISDTALNPTIISVPPEGLTITGTQSNFFDGVEQSLDVDFFQLAPEPGVDITDMTITSGFTGDFSFFIWQGPNTSQQINRSDAATVPFFPGDLPLSEGLFQYGIFDADAPSPPFDLVYSYEINISTNSSPVTSIEADSSDFYATSNGVLDAISSQLLIGDDATNDTYYSFIKFDISSLSSISTATLRLSLVGSNQSGDPDSDPPFGNPELGDVLVEAIPDYGTPDIGDITLLQQGPQQVLIPVTQNPDATLTLNVTDAVAAAIENGDDFVAFGIFIDEFIIEALDFDDEIDNFIFASADNEIASLRPMLDLTGEIADEPVVTLPPETIPPVGGVNEVLIDRTIDPNTPIELLITVGDAGSEPVRFWECASKDPRWNEVTQEWTVRDAAITEFDCPDIPGFADMDNIVPSYLRANVHETGPYANQAWVGFIFVDSGIGFQDLVQGQSLWENVDPRIKVDDCDVPVGDRDVDAWGSLINDPFNEERFLEDEYFEVSTGQCNRSRMIARRGSVFSGPWNDEISPQQLVWMQFMDAVEANGSDVSRACVQQGVRARIFSRLVQAGVALWRKQDYEKFVEKIEEADAFAVQYSAAFRDCPVNLLGDLRAKLGRAAFTAWDRIIFADEYVRYPAPNKQFPDDPEGNPEAEIEAVISSFGTGGWR